MERSGDSRGEVIATPRNVRLLTAVHFLVALRFDGPFLIVFYARVAGSFTLGMSVFAVASLAQAILDVPTGILSDSIGRKHVVVAGVALSVACAACYAVAYGYPLLALAAVLQGSAWAFGSGNNTALLYESLVERDGAERYPTFAGRVAGAEQLAFGASALAGALFAHWSLRLAFAATIVPQVIAVAVSLGLREPAIAARQRRLAPHRHLLQALRTFRASRTLQLLTSASAFRYAVGEAAYQFRQVFVATLWPTWALGVQSTLTSLGSAASFYFSGSIIRRAGAVRVLIGDAMLSRALTLTAVGFASAASPVLLASTALTYGPGQVAMDTLMQAEFTDEQRATLGSLVSQAGTLGYAFAAVIVGAIADKVGPMKTLLGAHIVLIAPLLLPLPLLARPPSRIARSE